MQAINVVFYHVALIICLGLAMPVGQLNLDVLYSRLLGPIKQGTMQGLFVAVGDLVTLCGPVIITFVAIVKFEMVIFSFLKGPSTSEVDLD